ncbi:unnamed protein product [Pleuronectes platessa]|uniref:Uncharacterized protein n=1 Tax=Pleuronectes platessa TaxID=8262 RepID=A0A9N7VUK2_PLEPL|nr:unnamed protein product [Pleuronectes platessa]
MAEILCSLPLCMRESERGRQHTQHGALAACSTSSFLTAVQEAGSRCSRPFIRPQRFSAELAKGQIFYGELCFRHSGRGQALGKCPAPNTYTLAYKQPCSKRAPPRWGCPSPESRNGRSKPPWSPPLPQPPLQP